MPAMYIFGLYKMHSKASFPDDVKKKDALN